MAVACDHKECKEEEAKMTAALDELINVLAKHNVSPVGVLTMCQYIAIVSSDYIKSHDDAEGHEVHSDLFKRLAEQNPGREKEMNTAPSIMYQ